MFILKLFYKCYLILECNKNNRQLDSQFDKRYFPNEKLHVHPQIRHVYKLVRKLSGISTNLIVDKSLDSKIF